MKVFIPVKLPKWTTWTAIDWFGVLIAFEHKPIRDGHDWIPVKGRKKDILQFDGQRYSRWTKTLCEINPVEVKP